MHWNFNRLHANIPMNSDSVKNHTDAVLRATNIALLYVIFEMRNISAYENISKISTDNLILIIAVNSTATHPYTFAYLSVNVFMPWTISVNQNDLIELWFPTQDDGCFPSGEDHCCNCYIMYIYKCYTFNFPMMCWGNKRNTITIKQPNRAQKKLISA